MDLLAEVLALSDVRGAVGARIEAGEDWGWWWNSATPRASLHAVTAGTVWVGLPDGPPLQLLPGDVVLLPGGAAHALGSDPSAVARTGPRTSDDWHLTSSKTVSIGTGPVRARILCADYDHDRTVSTQVLTLLPQVVHLRAGDDPDGLAQDTVRLLGRELATPRAATGLVLDRLVDVLLVHVLRAWLASGGTPAPSWLGALGDPVVAAAVTRLHEEPARPWTTATLAREVGVSRATLDRRFAAATGESPGAYLTRWRMDLAARRLRETQDSLDTIAAAVGYSSGYAFSRAFRRARSQPPGQFRATARSEGNPAPADTATAPV
ncbi:AraC family transcriptional regulator [Actinacidiphila glaucinigra]|uniref:AraC family transcriptional regulator n=1 Tax=Actinacidiphila glaucinigra TaxID=235986 RepID=UPI002DDB5D6B|nr:AraC family transcriptional regulator [Actinacidiphila glaucinigra]WSD57910.1 AraC family transcriptional regulator [Actinacidiphila glaucinigra]